MGKKSKMKGEYISLLKKQDHIGESKHLAKLNMREQNARYEPVKGIYSTSTFNTYMKCCKLYSEFLREKHPEVRSFSEGKNYISEFINTKSELSAWTQATYASGLCSAYNIQKSEIDYKFPERKRENITRSRECRSYRDSDPKYEDAKIFCKSTGARRCGIVRVTKSDIREKEDHSLEVFLKEKNGMSGWRMVLPEFQKDIKRIFEEAPGYRTSNGELRLFRKNALPTELHSCRAEYVCSLYTYYATEGNYTSGDLYYCRGDMCGTVFDKGILKKISLDVFHHRLDVVVTNYLYNYKK